MKILKKSISLVLAVVISATVLFGCTQREAHGELPEQGGENSQIQSEIDENTGDNTEIDTGNGKDEQTDLPITVTDQAGRTVTIESPAERIVSSYYISTALLVALGCEDEIVGIEMKADTRKLYELACPQLIELPAVGSGKGINVEQTAALEPDLVILPAKLAESAELFEELDIPTVIVNPETKEDFEACAELLGTLTGKTERAEQLLAYYHEKAEMIENLTSSLEKPSVYLSAGSSYLSSCSSQMYQTELIRICGGKSVTEEELTGTYWQNVSPEQLVEWNPEYFFAVSYAEYTLDDIRSDSAINGISAIENNKLYTFPSVIEPWDYPTPSSVLGIMWLAGVLHPEVYSPEQYLKDAKEFYKTFFDIEVSDDLLGVVAQQ